jgi:hypothetical protein
MRTCALVLGLQEFEAISKGVVCINATKPWKVGIPASVLPGRGQLLNHLIKVGHDDARMAFACRTKVVLGAEMQLDAASTKPGTSACREHWRLLNFSHSEHADEEVPGCRLLTSRHRQLHVVEALETHITIVAAFVLPLDLSAPLLGLHAAYGNRGGHQEGDRVSLRRQGLGDPGDLRGGRGRE